MNVAIVIDSGSGVSRQEAEEYGFFVVPMPFMIDGVEYEAGVNLSTEDFYEKMNAGADISTSAPSPARMTDIWDEILKEYDQIVHIPLSSGLSSTCQTATMLAEDYDGRVQVVDNQRVSITQRQAALDAKLLAEQGLDAAQIRDILMRDKMESSIYITLETLKYLKKGGRITPAAAALGTLLRIKPVLQIQGEKLDAFSKARTMKQAKATMLSALAHDLQERFHDPKAEHMWIAVAHTENEEMAQEFAQEIRELYPDAGEIVVRPLALNIACHIGPGSLAVGCSRHIDWKAE
jgi:DegV family protein with EDD domain